MIARAPALVVFDVEDGREVHQQIPASVQEIVLPSAKMTPAENPPQMEMEVCVEFFATC